MNRKYWRALFNVTVPPLVIGATLFSHSVAFAAGPEHSNKKKHRAARLADFSPSRHRTNEFESPAILSNQPPVNTSVTYPIPRLEPVSYSLKKPGEISIPRLPSLDTSYAGKVAGVTTKDEFIFYTVNPELQKFTRDIVKKARAPHVSVVTMNPRTGEILSIAEKSNTIKDLSLHAGFPAASIFKLVTTAAALEHSALSPLTPVPFRGGTYTLNQWNIFPNPKTDRKRMNLAEALGRSCNPVFARVALKYLSPRIIRDYAAMFGFNSSLGFEVTLPDSTASIPDTQMELGRTAAGFGAVTLSPIHAAALMSAIANHGNMPKPNIVSRVVDKNGAVVYQHQPEILRTIVSPKTAKTMLEMMQTTTTIGTSRNEFMSRNRPLLGNIDVAAKTGTLTGSNPGGVNHWFVAAAPIQNPKIAVSVIVVDPPRKGAKASRLGRELISRFLKS